MIHLNAFWPLLVYFGCSILNCETSEDKPNLSFPIPTPNRSPQYHEDEKLEPPFRPSEPHLPDTGFKNVHDSSDQFLPGFHPDVQGAATDTVGHHIPDKKHDLSQSSGIDVVSPQQGNLPRSTPLHDDPTISAAVKVLRDKSHSGLLSSSDSIVPPVHHSEGINSPKTGVPLQDEVFRVKHFHENSDPNTVVVDIPKGAPGHSESDQHSHVANAKLRANQYVLDPLSRSADISNEKRDIRLNPHSSSQFGLKMPDRDNINDAPGRVLQESVRDETRDDHHQFRRDSLPSSGPSSHTFSGRPSHRVPPEFQLDKTFVFPSKDIGQPGRLVMNSDDFVSLTVIVSPAVKECLFYTPLSNFVIDYQVIRGGSLDVGLFIKDPTGEPVVLRPPSPEASFSVTVPPPFKHLPYAICLDNRKASYAEKHVAISIDLDVNWDNPSEQERAILETIHKRSLTSTRLEAVDAKYLENWKALIIQLDNLFGRLRRIEHLQQKSDNFASVDKALMEANITRVTNGSIIQIIIMLGVATLQVILIRALFDTNSRFYRLWFGKRSKISARC